MGDADGRPSMSGMGEIWFALALTLIAGLATGVGGLLTFLVKDPAPRFLAGSLGFSAGVMTYVSLVELMPQSEHAFSTELGPAAGWAATASFFIGIGIAALIDRMVPDAMNPHEVPHRNEAPHRTEGAALKRLGILTAAVIAVHNFPEGFATFMSAIQVPHLALPVAMAIAIHNIPEGIAVAVPLYQATRRRWRSIGLATLSGLSEPVGGLLGYLFLRPFFSDSMLGAVFGVIAGIMVFISFDELLPTAESYGHHHVAMYGVIGGMALMGVSLQLL